MISELERKLDLIQGGVERSSRVVRYLCHYIKGLELVLTSMKLGRQPSEKALEMMGQAKCNLVREKFDL